MSKNQKFVTIKNEWVNGEKRIYELPESLFKKAWEDFGRGTSSMLVMLAPYLKDEILEDYGRKVVAVESDRSKNSKKFELLIGLMNSAEEEDAEELEELYGDDWFEAGDDMD